MGSKQGVGESRRGSLSFTAKTAEGQLQRKGPECLGSSGSIYAGLKTSPMSSAQVMLLAVAMG